MNSELLAHDFLGLFGEKNSDKLIFIEEFKSFLSRFNFEYILADRKLFEKCLLEILTRLDDGSFDASGYQRIEKWEKGWSENLSDFIQSDFDTEKLIPKYYRDSNLSRYKGDLIETKSPTFQYDFFQVLRFYIAKKYLMNYSNIFEFACGPGHNIVAINNIIKSKHINYQGLDWSISSVKIVNEIAKRKNINCRGTKFNFYMPDYSLSFPDDTVLLTFGGLEQVGENHDEFLKFIMNKKPSLCINVEPIHELYNTDSLLDYLASKYHHSRNYLKNYLSKLLLLEKHGDLLIEKISRVPFGSIWHEGWNIIVWKPL